jgi:quercetin dioxygenase-like cupin family protein
MTERLFFNLDARDQGVFRELAPGITTRVFPGEQAMLSVVQFEPGAKGALHQHPEEQWGVCLSGSGIRIQGGTSTPVADGDFWRTPGNTPHTMVAGPDGMIVLDVFAPPRRAYETPGAGFATSSD